MKKMVVEVCACPECVMKGAMDIVESIESLKKLKVQLRFNTQIAIAINSRLGDSGHGARSPLLRLDGELIEHATSELVMARILGAAQQE